MLFLCDLKETVRCFASAVQCGEEAEWFKEALARIGAVWMVLEK